MALQRTLVIGEEIFSYQRVAYRQNFCLSDALLDILRSKLLDSTALQAACWMPSASPSFHSPHRAHRLLFLFHFLPLRFHSSSQPLDFSQALSASSHSATKCICFTGIYSACHD